MGVVSPAELYLQDFHQRLRSELLRAVSYLRQSDGKIETGWGLRLVRAQAA